ncbi:hypothetical protein LI224_19610, partial [Erysipelatoclostridium ramosum]|uniref:hypothetical protein n=1 Tax=Thomasclavelia ramosa TaxID=1547 RepID=UPI001D093065
GKLPGYEFSLHKAKPAYLPAGYMASCHVGMEYRFCFLTQGPGCIFLAENLHPALWLLDCSAFSGVKKV